MKIIQIIYLEKNQTGSRINNMIGGSINGFYGLGDDGVLYKKCDYPDNKSQWEPIITSNDVKN